MTQIIVTYTIEASIKAQTSAKSEGSIAMSTIYGAMRPTTDWDYDASGVYL